MASWEFPRSDPIDLHVALESGTVTITAEPTEAVVVSLRPSRPGDEAEQAISDVRVEYVDGRLDIAGPRHIGLRWHSEDLDLAVTLPPGSRCTLRTAAADIACHGELGSLDAVTASGGVSAAEVQGPVRVTTVSGAVSLGTTAADVAATTASGHVRVSRAAGDVSAKTVSGTIVIGAAEASVAAKTASGAVRMASVARGHADAISVSGDIEVRVAPGAGAYLDISSLSGRVTSDLDPEQESPGRPDLRVTCRTVSGSVRLTRAAPADITS